MHLRGLCAATLLSACATNTSRVEERRTEITFIIPEAVRPLEPKADRVSLLFGSGRVVSYDDATLRRAQDRLTIEHGKDLRAEHGVAEVRAVQLETSTRDVDAAAARTARDSKDTSAATSAALWGLAGVVTLVVIIALSAN
ncbi:MAG: hypothetical protein IT385_27165 [Deltaproteobacteria bacterium]|nr:hypothetical protein [Deltaproteobacteria bacterium]